MIQKPLNLKKFFFLSSLIPSFLIFLQPALAFYEIRTPDNSLDVRGSIQALGAFIKNPGEEGFYPKDTEFGAGGIGRLLIFSQHKEKFGFEFNGFQFYTKSILTAFGSQGSFPTGTQRSSAFEWEQRNDSYAQAGLGIDRFNLRLSTDSLDLTVGRQAINLGTVFYFTPNDFFGPFSPNAFFRLYKPGVDAARAEFRLADLSQFTLISVLGYQPDPTEPNGWSKDSRLDRSSLLGRLLITHLDFEWSLLGGSVKNQSLIGAGFQGELFDGLGLRFEGHYAWAGANVSGDLGKVALNLEHRFENSLTASLEQYYKSQGYHSNRALNNLLLSGRLSGIFNARHYSAMGLGYELTPLFSAEILAILNWVDPSTLLSLNSLYSLADEMDLVTGISLPLGARPSGATLESEFGALPFVVSVEVRYFF